MLNRVMYWYLINLWQKENDSFAWERNLKVEFTLNMLCLILGLNEIIFSDGDFSSKWIKHSILKDFIHVWCVWKCFGSENPSKMGLKIKSMFWYQNGTTRAAWALPGHTARTAARTIDA